MANFKKDSTRRRQDIWVGKLTLAQPDNPKAAGPNIKSSADGASVIITNAAGTATTLNATELGFTDGVTAGTVTASKALVVDANKDIASLRNVTITGNLVTGTTTLSEAELAVLDAVTGGTVTASKAAVVDANKDLVALRNLTVTNLDAGASGTAGSVDVFPTTAAKGKTAITSADNAGDTTTAISVQAQAGARSYTVPDAGADAAFDLVKGNAAVAGGAGWTGTLVARKTGIANNTATDMITVTVPNGNHNAGIFLDIMAHLGTGTDASESTRVATGVITLARQTGAATVAVVSTLAQAQIATSAGGGTLTLAYGVSAMTGAVGATQTFTIQVTLVVTGTITDHVAMIFARSLNSYASGVTMAAA